MAEKKWANLTIFFLEKQWFFSKLEHFSLIPGRLFFQRKKNQFVILLQTKSVWTIFQKFFFGIRLSLLEAEIWRVSPCCESCRHHLHCQKPCLRWNERYWKLALKRKFHYVTSNTKFLFCFTCWPSRELFVTKYLV